MFHNLHLLLSFRFRPFTLTIRPTKPASAEISHKDAIISSATSEEMAAKPSEQSVSEEIEEEIASISEHISLADSEDIGLSSGAAVLPNAITLKRRQLFDIVGGPDDDDDDLDRPSGFSMDDLSGDNIAQHFKVSIDERPADSDSAADNIDDSLNEQRSKATISSRQSEQLSATKITGSNNSSSADVEHVSPKLDSALSQQRGGQLDDGVILINNDQVSLMALKVRQEPKSTSDELSLSNLAEEKAKLRRDQSAGSIEEIRSRSRAAAAAESAIKNTLTIENEDEAAAEASATSSYEEDHSIEEVVLSNASIDPGQHDLSQHSMSELDANNIDVNNESQMNNILADTIERLPVFSEPSPHSLNDTIEDQINDILADTVDHLPVFADQQIDSLDALHAIQIVQQTIDELPRAVFAVEPLDSLDNLSDGIFDLKKNILEHAEPAVAPFSLEPSSSEDDQPNFQTPPIVVVVKQMEKIDYSTKEALEDISEEESALVSLERHQHSVASLHSSTDGRRVAMAQSQREDYSVIPNEPAVIQLRSVIDEVNENSFDSVISLNMLEIFENKVKELEDIVATKDVCLTALNMQLESVYRKEHERESAGVVQQATSTVEACSLATTTSSTEYRMYPDEYANRVSQMV